MGEIEVVSARLPGGIRGLLAQRGAQQVIIVDERLSPAQRTAVVMHERVHVERCGSGWHPAMPPGLKATVQREEIRVDRIAASRIIPPHELAHTVKRLVDIGVEASPRVIAGLYDTTDDVAMIALDQLARQEHAA